MDNTKNKRKTVLIAGGAGGLGRALALLYARRGCWVAVADVDLRAAERVLDEIRDSGADGACFELDVTSEAGWAELRRSLRTSVGQLDVLINCAAKLSVGDVGQLPLATEKETLDVSLMGTVFGCQTMVPWLKDRAQGQIVNVASCAAFLGMPWSASYNAAKAGIVAYSETLHNELAGHGVHVTVACPGFFPSSMFEQATFASPGLRDTVQHIVKNSPLTPERVAEEIARAVDKGRLYVMTPLAVRRLWWMKRLAPRRLLSSIASRADRLRQRISDERG